MVAHGGRISLEDTGQGASFEIVLPLEGPEGDRRMTVVERRTKALLVEDDPNIVDLIRSNLTVRGFDTCVSPDGSRAQHWRPRRPTWCCST